MKQVRIVAKDPQIDITIPMGDQSARPTGGLGGWVEVDLQDDLAASDWEGQPLLREDIPLLLDAYPHGSVQREWETVLKLGRDPNGDENVPPIFRVYGPLDHDGKAWVLPDDGIEILDSEIEPIKRHDGDWQRIEFVLHLMEYRRPDTINVRRRKKSKRRAGVGPGRPLTYTTAQGDTLVKVAAKPGIFGDWKRWKEIGEKNGISDPHRVLPPGTELRI